MGNRNLRQCVADLEQAGEAHEHQVGSGIGHPADLRQQVVDQRRTGIALEAELGGHARTPSGIEQLGELLQLVGRLTGKNPKIMAVLERVGLAGRGSDRTSNLSGGEKQRVAVARAIVPEPALILADEPTGNLDPHLAIDILTLFEEINTTGTTVLFATHDHSLISKRDHRLISIDEGRVVEAQKGLKQWPGSGIHTLVG